ncbi:MAG: formyl transferase [Candidatus Helarchaeota archaeon]|nr:formyl transferase [Candidatus Helarchaeota archaeon]
MSNSLRIVILTTKLPEDIWLINKLADVCKIEGIVIPRGKRWKEFGVLNVLKKRMRRFGFFGVTNQTLLILYRLLLERRKDKKSLAKIFTQKPYDYIEKEDIRILEVDNINSEKVPNFIRSINPDVVVVSGTPLLKESVIQSVSGRIINLHPGFPPQYRGRYGAFWPIYNKEPELVGTTIHFIDKGIDTGAILIQQQVAFDKNDTVKTITYKQHETGVRLLVKCLTDFNNIAAQAFRKTGYPSKNYYAPGLTHYLKAKRWLKKQNAY